MLKAAGHTIEGFLIAYRVASASLGNSTSGTPRLWGSGVAPDKEVLNSSQKASMPKQKWSAFSESEDNHLRRRTLFSGAFYRSNLGSISCWPPWKYWVEYPRSVTLALYVPNFFLKTRTFSGFMSLCTMPQQIGYRGLRYRTATKLTIRVHVYNLPSDVYAEPKSFVICHIASSTERSGASPPGAISQS